MRRRGRAGVRRVGGIILVIEAVPQDGEITMFERIMTHVSLFVLGTDGRTGGKRLMTNKRPGKC